MVRFAPYNCDTNMSTDSSDSSISIPIIKLDKYIVRMTIVSRLYCNCLDNRQAFNGVEFTPEDSRFANDQRL